MDDAPRPLPPRLTDTETCRTNAEAAGSTERGLLWALLAVAGELAAIRKLLGKR
ncbi:hypothetical protein AB0J30_15015 [Streptomyces microflavus]|uniref:hypothetical protein n=1 Tax=Streptomyces microflavus TaxID=1919 RepID=UPI003448AD6B